MKNQLIRAIESVIGVVLSKSSKGSLVLTKKKHLHHAWFSQKIQLQTLLDDLEINLVLDVGANEGQFAKQLRRLYKGQICSFEPIPSVFKTLSQAAQKDDKWDVFNFALGASDGDMEINISEMSVFSSFHETNEFSQNKFGRHSRVVEKMDIEVRTLEGFLSSMIGDQSSRRIFLKTDTQGHDLEVFHGLGGFVEQVYGLQSELSVIPIYQDIPHWTQCIAIYEKAGFTVVGMFPLNRDSYKVVEYDCLFVKK